MNDSLDPVNDRYFEPGAPDRRINKDLPANYSDFVPGVGQMPLAPQPVTAGQHHGNVNHSMPTPSVKPSRPKAVYTREQKGHSLLAHLLFGIVTLWIPAIYYTVSPNHYWHI